MVAAVLGGRLMPIVRAQNADLALLSINTFQKDLSNPNPRVRANAMRAMSSIRLPVVVPLVRHARQRQSRRCPHARARYHQVVIGIWQAVKDSSSYVRKAAACAIPKVFRCVAVCAAAYARRSPRRDAPMARSIDQTQKDELIEMIEQLLRKDDTEVLGCALFAFREVCTPPRAGTAAATAIAPMPDGTHNRPGARAH